MFDCNRCDARLTHAELLSKHKREMHTAITISLNNDPVTVSPDAKGNYECVCPLHIHSTTYLGYTSFMRHLLQTSEVLKTSQKLEEMTAFIGHDLVQTDVLSQQNLCINVVHNVAICLSCAHSVCPSQLVGHFKTCRDQHLPSKAEGAVKKVLEAFSVGLELPVLSGHNHEIIKGIQIANGFACTKCPKAFEQHKGLKAHFREDHSHSTVPDSLECRCLLQRLQDNNRSPWFSVRPCPPVAQESDGLAALLPLTEPEQPTRGGEDIRNVCPWLRHVRWHDITQDLDLKDVLRLTAPPKDGEFPNLREHVYGAIRSITDKLDKIPELVLQKINTEVNDQT